MAPEILMDDPYNEKADIFSFAMVITELITRKKPPERTANDMYAFNIDEFRRQCPRDTPRILVSIVTRCANLTPSKRPALTEILKKLENYHKNGEKEIANKNIQVQFENIDEQQQQQQQINFITAVKNYKAKDEVELNIKKGDKITIIQADESGWCEGSINNQRGWFPKFVLGENYQHNQNPDRNSVDAHSLTSVEHRSNANKQLLNFLTTRPAQKDLLDRGILPATRKGSLQTEVERLEKKRKIDALSKFLRKKIIKRTEQVVSQSIDEDILDKIINALYTTNFNVQTIKKKYEAYEKCFYGLELLEWLVENRFASDNSNSRSIGLYLLHRRIIIPVDFETIEFKEKRLYQLKLHQEAPDLQVINNIKTWKNEPNDPLSVIISLIKNFSFTSETVHIDIAICELQKVNLSLLSSNTDKSVFFLNLYNLMMNYILIRFGKPENEFMDKELQTKKAFLVGTSVFTLDFIKRSILFGLDAINDPRGAFKASTDLAVLCLTANASQSPPLEVYDPSNFLEVYPSVLKSFFDCTFESTGTIVSYFSFFISLF